MKLEKLRLQNFRNYKKRQWELKERMVVVGANGAGKSNLVEGIALLSRGESFRAGKIEEMVGWGKEVGRVKGRIKLDGEVADVEVVLTGGEVEGEKVAKRKYLVNGIVKRRMDFVGKLVVVLFRPEDLDLVGGGPSGRRQWLNEVICGVDREYVRSVGSYEKALRRRNKILDLIREGEVGWTQLAFWDQLLIRHGMVLTVRRRELVEFINSFWAEQKTGLELEYDFSAISEKRLAQYKDEEVAAGFTLVGPHKDELVFVSTKSEARNSKKDLAIYGSRGEQRMAVLWLKLGELEFVEQERGERPVLLLDDIFSELDQEHRQMVLKVMGKQQTIMTSTEVELLGDVGKMEVVKL